jgi:SAM-dependent methyltransferase
MESALQYTLLEGVTLESPAIIYNGPPPGRDSRQFLSVMMEVLPREAFVLDLGCGPRDQAGAVEHLGYRYIGADYSSDTADVLADAHCLPFPDRSFDCVFSFAVLEHLHSPFTAIQEIERVLKPFGFYIGTVSQGEPFHSSYFHHTPWGLAVLARSTANIRLLRLWSGPGTLQSLAEMGRYPWAIKMLLKIVDRIDRSFPLLAPRRAYWTHRQPRCSYDAG